MSWVPIALTTSLPTGLSTTMELNYHFIMSLPHLWAFSFSPHPHPGIDAFLQCFHNILCIMPSLLSQVILELFIHQWTKLDWQLQLPWGLDCVLFVLASPVPTQYLAHSKCEWIHQFTMLSFFFPTTFIYLFLCWVFVAAWVFSTHRE